MENLIVIIIIGFAAGLLGRNYYRKYKKTNQCRCGCTSCPMDLSSCEFPAEQDNHLSEVQKSIEN